MGYESKIYIVEKSNLSWHDDNGKRYARDIATIDMSKCYELSDILRNKPATGAESQSKTTKVLDLIGHDVTTQPSQTPT